jgi:hypothetical protein
MLQQIQNEGQYAICCPQVIRDFSDSFPIQVSQTPIISEFKAVAIRACGEKNFSIHLFLQRKNQKFQFLQGRMLPQKEPQQPAFGQRSLCISGLITSHNHPGLELSATALKILGNLTTWSNTSQMLFIGVTYILTAASPY